MFLWDLKLFQLDVFGFLIALLYNFCLSLIEKSKSFVNHGEKFRLSSFRVCSLNGACLSNVLLRIFSNSFHRSFGVSLSFKIFIVVKFSCSSFRNWVWLKFRKSRINLRWKFGLDEWYGVKNVIIGIWSEISYMRLSVLVCSSGRLVYTWSIKVLVFFTKTGG